MVALPFSDTDASPYEDQAARYGQGAAKSAVKRSSGTGSWGALAMCDWRGRIRASEWQDQNQQPGHRSNRNDLDDFLHCTKVIGIAGVERQVVCSGSGGDQQVGK